LPGACFKNKALYQGTTLVVPKGFWDQRALASDKQTHRDTVIYETLSSKTDKGIRTTPPLANRF
jgi:hypothetical protein